MVNLRKQAFLVTTNIIKTQVEKCMRGNLYNYRQCTPEIRIGIPVNNFDEKLRQYSLHNARYTLKQNMDEQTKNPSTLFRINSDNKSEVDYDALLAILLKNKSPGIIFEGYWPVVEETLQEIRKTLISSELRKYFTIEEGHVIWVKIKKTGEGEYKLTTQTITSKYNNPETNMLYLIDTGIRNSKTKDATSAIHGKANMYKGSPEDFISILKILDKTKNLSQDKIPTKYQALFNVYAQMQTAHISEIKKLIQNKKIPHDELINVEQKIQTNAFLSLEAFFKNPNYFKPRAENSFERLHINLAKLKLNKQSQYKAIIEKDFGDFIFLRKAYTSKEYWTTLLNFRKIMSLELADPYYFLTQTGQDEHRKLTANTLNVIDGLINKSKTTWYE